MSHVEFDDLKRGDRVRFLTTKGVLVPPEKRKEMKKRLERSEVWRTGTVLHVTEKAITVDCDMPNDIGHTAIIRKAVWDTRNVELLQEG